MEILYVSSVPSPDEFARMKTQIRENVNVTTYGMNESGFKFHTLIMNGLCADPTVHICSLVGRSIARSTHRGFFWKRKLEKVSDQLTYDHIGCINFPAAKQLLMGISYFFRTLSWLMRHRGEERGIIMDAAYVTVLPFVLAANRFFHAPTTAIYCDLYDYMADVKDARENAKLSLPKRILKRVTAHSYANLDSYIFLTEAMNPVINRQQKPYIVMEGLVDIHMQVSENDPDMKAPGKVVMYAGALREPYGLKNLVDGFRAYDDPDTVLWIYGDGDYKDAICRAQTEDPRIHYFGAVPLQTVEQQELRASLLVNPRPADKEFTKYSFPSKNMEYMVSGTPILTTRLPGMPLDYYDYIFTIDGDCASDITHALQQVFSLSGAQLQEKGASAKRFVLEQKNNVIQAGRILSLLKR